MAAAPDTPQLAKIISLHSGSIFLQLYHSRNTMSSKLTIFKNPNKRRNI